MKFIRLLGIITVIFFGLNSSAEEKPYTTQEFKDYWYAGKAEITSYELKQARYGEVHEGYAVLIFVTEDFSENKQVKLDNPSAAGEDAVKVLKLNFLKKFNTGIYRYSIMESVFTPVSTDIFPNSLKVTMSSQEWCGHAYTQMNLRNNEYNIESFSYFESEGDNKLSVEKAFLEDEIWNRIRLNPDELPTGMIRIIPNVIISRLLHTDLGIEDAIASLSESSHPDNHMTYSLVFPETQREFTVKFEKKFPHRIISWKEKYKSGFGSSSKTLISTAKRKKTLFTDYWNKNSVNDVKLRNKLDIE